MQGLLGTMRGTLWFSRSFDIHYNTTHTHPKILPSHLRCLIDQIYVHHRESVPRCEYIWIHIWASTKTFGCAQCSMLVALWNSKANHWLFLGFSYVQISHALRTFLENPWGSCPTFQSNGWNSHQNKGHLGSRYFPWRNSPRRSQEAHGRLGEPRWLGLKSSWRKVHSIQMKGMQRCHKMIVYRV